MQKKQLYTIYYLTKEYFLYILRIFKPRSNEASVFKIIKF